MFLPAPETEEQFIASFVMFAYSVQNTEESPSFCKVHREQFCNTSSIHDGTELRDNL